MPLLDLYLQGTPVEDSPSLWQELSLTLALSPKQSIPTQMWLSSPAHQLLPALPHPTVSFQSPSRLLPVVTASKGEADAWKHFEEEEAVWVAGPRPVVQSREGENPLGLTGVGAAPSVSPAFPAIFHTFDLFSCRNVSPKPVYSKDGNSCGCIQQEKLAEQQCFWLAMKFSHWCLEQHWCWAILCSSSVVTMRFV